MYFEEFQIDKINVFLLHVFFRLSLFGPVIFKLYRAETCVYVFCHLLVYVCTILEKPNLYTSIASGNYLMPAPSLTIAINSRHHCKCQIAHQLNQDQGQADNTAFTAGKTGPASPLPPAGESQGHDGLEGTPCDTSL